MRRGFGFLGLVLTAILLVAVGVISYQAGWSSGIATQVPAGTTAVAPYYYGYGPHFWGFGIFGFFALLFFVFLFFGLIRAAMWGRMGGGWGYRGGHKHGFSGGGVPPAIEERMQEWHRRAHGEPTPAPPPDTKEV